MLRVHEQFSSLLSKELSNEEVISDINLSRVLLTKQENNISWWCYDYKIIWHIRIALHAEFWGYCFILFLNDKKKKGKLKRLDRVRISSRISSFVRNTYTQKICT